MTASVTFCDMKECTFWREPNTCISDEVEIECGECVTYDTPERQRVEDELDHLATLRRR
jgi:hypothetical protein